MEHSTFWQGVKECIPTLLGYAGIGLSFGIVAAAANFSILEITLLSLLVYAGVAQFIICTLLLAGTPFSAIVLTTFIVNSRMFLLSMTLAPTFKSYGFLNRVGLGFLVTDETFGVAITPRIRGELITDRWMHGINITAYLFWTFSTIIGAVFGDYIQHPEALGLDFAITAMFVFLTIAQFETVKRTKIMKYLVLMSCVVVMMLLLSLIMPSYVAIILSSTITAALGVVMDR